jgi:hypothetical protein
VPACCDPEDYESVFTGRFARRVAKRYTRRGLSQAADQIVQFVVGRGVKGASILEIGGGVGEIQVELLRRGASKVTNLEISTQYGRRRHDCCSGLAWPVGSTGACSTSLARRTRWSRPMW